MSAPVDLQFEHESGCLIVRARSRHVLEQKIAAVKEIAAAIKAHSIKATLVDLREVPGPYTFMDRYQLGEHAGRYLTQVPVAVLLLEKQADRQLIGKLVANNRGANVEVFTDPAAARAWLEKYQTPHE